MGAGPAPDAKNDHEFETARLEMTLPVKSDAEVLYRLIGGPDRRSICATLVWDGPRDLSETEGWVEKVRASTFEEIGFHWVIRDRVGSVTDEPGQPLGAIGTRPRDNPGRADVGYWLGRPYWGQGLMSEALMALLVLGFTSLEFYKMEADVFGHNQRGIRLVERAGMRREGLIRKAHRKYGELVDVAVYGILREEWDSER